MTTTTAIPSPSIRPLPLVASLVLAVFGVFSIWVVATHGYFGFIALAGREPWALQMLIDLVISAAFAVGWMIGDARKRRIATWPYIVATVLLGSIGVLAYCVRRSFTPPQGT
jgi:nitrate reductase NapE component